MAIKGRHKFNEELQNYSESYNKTTIRRNLLIQEKRLETAVSTGFIKNNFFNILANMTIRRVT
jgi:hypothetical protein